VPAIICPTFWIGLQYQLCFVRPAVCLRTPDLTDKKLSAILSIAAVLCLTRWSKGQSLLEYLFDRSAKSTFSGGLSLTGIESIEEGRALCSRCVAQPAEDRLDFLPGDALRNECAGLKIWYREDNSEL
jgi:hypothetical protein